MKKKTNLKINFRINAFKKEMRLLKLKQLLKLMRVRTFISKKIIAC